MKDVSKGFSITVGVLLAVVICCSSLCLCVSYFMIKGNQMASESATKREQAIEQKKVEEEKALVAAEVFSQEGTGKTSTNKFSLVGNKTTIHYKVSNNQNCISWLSDNDPYCSPDYLSMNLICGDDVFGDLIVNEITADAEKDIVTYKGKGSCYIEISANSDANWLVTVIEEQ